EHIPYDQFLTWQLAGDLLPDPSREQLVATGFNRNHKTTAEGGAVDEEYRTEYVHDRVATTATTFMGLTMECARCHDHKYDPVSQEEYYRFFAFFNQVDELGLTGDDGNAGPNLLLPAPETELKLKAIRQQLREKESALVLSNNELAEQQAFIKQLKIQSPSAPKQAGVHLPFDLIADEKIDRYAYSRVSGEAAIVEDTERGTVLELDGEYEFINVRDQGLFEQFQPFSASIWIRPQGRSSSQTIMGNSAQKGTFWRGWDFALDSLNHLSLRLIHALPHDVLAVRTAVAVPTGSWTHVAFSYDGSGRAAGVELYVNGKPTEKVIIYDRLQRSIYPIAFSKERTKTPLRLGKSYRAFTGEYGIFSGRLDEFHLFARALSGLEVAELAGTSSVKTVLEQYQKEPELVLGRALLTTWQVQHPPPEQLELTALRQQQQELLDTVPETMIMQEVAVPRATFILHRGNYNEPTREVQAGTPAAVLPFADTLEPNRLGLAKWLLQPDHPLTSRVLANRIWQQFFGRGLVDTPHDLGLQGSLPIHPQLLDWLAAHLMGNGWNIQELQKQIVLSATYRQSSKMNAALTEKDPDNRLLARGPSYRLPAEMIRDNALAAADLLEYRVGGPSVKPVQPPGLWQEKTSSTHLLRKYEPDAGSNRYRRSLYTFIRRTSPHPAMTAFDVPNRSVCTAQRPRTNTPMQALVLLNDPEFVEASRYVAQRVMSVEATVEARIEQAFRLLTGKRPDDHQLSVLLELYDTEKERFAADPASATRYIAIGQFPPDASLEPIELGTMTLVANTIMNFDDFYMKR
ncbi:MAG: DUF1553 domain-containing protein, partial [Lewinella sp.]|nr:DUF1553 domain-containing protein [Lewinella sp.]